MRSMYRLAVVRIIITICVLVAGVPVVFAGGPLVVDFGGSGIPYTWPGAAAFFHVEAGPLNSTVTNAMAKAEVISAFAAWEGVPTATITYTDAGPLVDRGDPADGCGTGLPIDVDETNFFCALPLFPDGQSPIIFDDNGDLFALLGLPPGVLGFSGPEFITLPGPPFDILEGFTVLNGSAVAPLGAFALAEFRGVFVHEFGHFSNLAHSVVNGQAFFFGDETGPTPGDTFGPPPASAVETMYPLLSPTTGPDQATPHADDIANLSTLYPAAGFPGSFGTISGQILDTDGVTGLTGINVIARNPDDPFHDAVSVISGDLTQGFGPLGLNDGLYTLNGLTPGARYVTYIDEILAGGFSTPLRGNPFGPVPVVGPFPGPEEFYSGPTESADPATDDPADSVLVPATAVTSGIDIIVNEPPPDPHEPNNTFAAATAIPCPFTGVDTAIAPLGDVDVYRFEITAPTLVTIDMDAVELGSSLDSVLGLFDSTGTLFALSDDNPAPGEPFTFDSFLQLVIPNTGTFFLGVSSFDDFNFDGIGDSGFFNLTTGLYTLSVTCALLPPPPGPGDLLGSTGAQGRTLIDIDPATGAGTLRAPQGALGPVTDIEFRSDGTLFGATGGGASSIITINPSTGQETLVGVHVFGAVNGLEFVGSTLYGTYMPFPEEPSDLVIVDQTSGALTFIGPTGFSPIGGLAFDPRTGTMYGVTAGFGGGDLITLDLTTGAGTFVGPTGFDDVAALEFGPDGTLFGGVGGASLAAGSLIIIDPATGAGTVVGPTGFRVLSGLAFVPEVPPECLQGVDDQQPPTIGTVTANPNTLWPPNHKMVPVTVVASVSDNCDSAPVCQITAVSSNEPVNGGDGDTAPDWELTGDLTVDLRAERAGSGNGRVYTLTVECRDAAHNSASKAITVTVPHDQGKKGKK
jgi:hypothetical protein